MSSMYIVDNEQMCTWVEHGFVHFGYGPVFIHISIREFEDFVDSLINAEHSLELGKLPVAKEECPDLTSSSDYHIWINEDSVFIEYCPVTLSIPIDEFGDFVGSLLTTRQRIEGALKEIHKEE